MKRIAQARIYSSTNLRCQEAWHGTKRDRGAAGQKESWCCNAWHRCIVKDTVKMIHFLSNNLQYTTRCPQKVYIASKWLLNVFFTLKLELQTQGNIHHKWDLTNNLIILDRSFPIWGGLLGGGLTLRINWEYWRWRFWGQSVLLACYRWCGDKIRLTWGIKCNLNKIHFQFSSIWNIKHNFGWLISKIQFANTSYTIS